MGDKSLDSFCDYGKNLSDKQKLMSFVDIYRYDENRTSVMYNSISQRALPENLMKDRGNE